MLVGIFSFPLMVAKKSFYFLVSWYSYYPNFIISIHIGLVLWCVVG